MPAALVRKELERARGGLDRISPSGVDLALPP